MKHNGHLSGWLVSAVSLLADGPDHTWQHRSTRVVFQKASAAALPVFCILEAVLALVGASGGIAVSFYQNYGLAKGARAGGASGRFAAAAGGKDGGRGIKSTAIGRIDQGRGSYRRYAGSRRPASIRCRRTVPPARRRMILCTDLPMLGRHWRWRVGWIG
jgi:hypothetical protein